MSFENVDQTEEGHAAGVCEDSFAERKSEAPGGGRRIVNLIPLFDAIRKIDLHNGENSCNFSTMSLTKEFRYGLNSIFTFTCDVCGYIGTIKSNPTSNGQIEINYASALAAYAIGIGFYQSQEFLATLDIPFMAVSTFDKRQKLLQDDLRTVAQELENEAMTKEKEIAVEKKETDVNG